MNWEHYFVLLAHPRVENGGIALVTWGMPRVREAYGSHALGGTVLEIVKILLLFQFVLPCFKTDWNQMRGDLNDTIIH